MATAKFNPTAARKLPTHILDNNEIEDEADIVAYTFEEVDADYIRVTPRYNGYPHWEIATTYTRGEARALWARIRSYGWKARTIPGGVDPR